jgi:6-phosphofructokinase 2
MIATITLNPSLDEDIFVDGLVLDEANRWVRLRRYPGGKGIDVSRAIHEMGDMTVAYGLIGGPVGRIVEILLDEEGVLYSFTPIEQETRTNFIITDTRSLNQTRIDAPGPHVSRRELERFLKKIRRIPSPDLVAIGGSMPPNVPLSLYAEIIKEYKKRGIRTIFDTEGQWLDEGVKAKPYLIKPNLREAARLLGRKLDSEEEIIRAARELVKDGIEIAVISRGKDGVIAASKTDVIKAIPPTVKVRGTVGAGDCTVAGLALKLAYGGSLIEACRLGVAMGTACVLRPGVELCRKLDVEKLLPQIKVYKMVIGQDTKTFVPISYVPK